MTVTVTVCLSVFHYRYIFDYYPIFDQIQTQTNMHIQQHIIAFYF